MTRAALMLLVAIAMPRVASADPTIGRVLTAPTAWLPPSGAITGTAGLELRSIVEDRSAMGNVVVGYGLGGLASVELGADTDVRTCADCTGDATPRPKWLGRASFRLGARQDQWFVGMPALVLGVRTTFAGKSRDVFERPRVSEAYVVASRVIGPLRFHVGASVTDAGFADVEMGLQVRPLAGIEWTPAQYPRTSLMGDAAYSAVLEPDVPRLEWVAGWGVRYQALSWASIELAVRHREGEGLDRSTVLMRVNGVWDPGRSGKR